MAYRLPVFNTLCNIWDNPPVPPAPPSDTVLCNLAWGRRVAVPSTGGTDTLGVVLMTMTLLVPSGTVLQGDPNLLTGSIVEVPAGSGRMYNVAMADMIAVGFANEHVGAILVQVAPFPPTF